MDIAFSNFELVMNRKFEVLEKRFTETWERFTAMENTMEKMFNVVNKMNDTIKSINIVELKDEDSHDISSSTQEVILQTKCSFRTIEVKFFNDPSYLVPLLKGSLLELYNSIKYIGCSN